MLVAMEVDETSAVRVQKKKLTLPFEEYKSLSNMLIVYMRNEELKCKLFY